MITEFMDENNMFDLGNLIPTNTELDRVINNLENNKITSDDQIVLFKIELIEMIMAYKDTKI